MQRFVRMVGGALVSMVLVASGAVCAAEAAADAGTTGQSGAPMHTEKHKAHRHDEQHSRHRAKKKQADADKTTTAAPAALPR